MTPQFYNNHTLEELQSFYDNALTSTIGVKLVAEACTPQWVSVKDRLPKEEKEYLVLLSDGSISNATFVLCRKTFGGKYLEGWIYEGVTHWSDALPPSPQAGGENE